LGEGEKRHKNLRTRPPLSHRRQADPPQPPAAPTCGVMENGMWARVALTASLHSELSVDFTQTILLPGLHGLVTAKLCVLAIYDQCQRSSDLRLRSG
jgi:hypothetical protein